MSRNMVILIVLILILSIAPLTFYRPITKPISQPKPEHVRFNTTATILDTQPYIFFLGYSNVSDKKEVEQLLDKLDLNYTVYVTLSSNGYLFKITLYTDALDSGFKANYFLSKILHNVVGYKYGIVQFKWENMTLSSPATLYYSRFKNMTTNVFCEGWKYKNQLRVDGCIDVGETFLYGLTFEQFSSHSSQYTKIISGSVAELGDFLLRSNQSYNYSVTLFNNKFYYIIPPSDINKSLNGTLYRIVKIKDYPYAILAHPNISVGDRIEAKVNVTKVFGIDVYGFGVLLNTKAR